MRAIVCGLRSRNSLVNHRSILASTIAAKPLSRTVLSRPSHSALSAKYAEVLDNTSLSMRAGALGAEPLSDHAAHRQSAPTHFADAQCIDHCEHVAAEPLHRIG